jgi:hypothetical protein
MSGYHTEAFTNLSSPKLSIQESALASKLMTASFEHAYYQSYADECQDPLMKEDLLGKMDQLSQNYLLTRNQLASINPDVLQDFENYLIQQKALYFSSQLLN